MCAALNEVFIVECRYYAAILQVLQQHISSEHLSMQIWSNNKSREILWMLLESGKQRAKWLSITQNLELLEL